MVPGVQSTSCVQLTLCPFAMPGHRLPCMLTRWLCPDCSSACLGLTGIAAHGATGISMNCCVSRRRLVLIMWIRSFDPACTHTVETQDQETWCTRDLAGASVLQADGAVAGAGGAQRGAGAGAAGRRRLLRAVARAADGPGGRRRPPLLRLLRVHREQHEEEPAAGQRPAATPERPRLHADFCYWRPSPAAEN